MTEDRIREILNQLIIGNATLNDELVSEILLSENLKKDIHPLMALAINYLIEVWEKKHADK